MYLNLNGSIHDCVHAIGQSAKKCPYICLTDSNVEVDLTNYFTLFMYYFIVPNMCISADSHTPFLFGTVILTDSQTPLLLGTVILTNPEPPSY